MNTDKNTYRDQITKELLYLEYKKQALNYLLKHDATDSDSEPTTLPDLSSNLFREEFSSGKTIKELCYKINEAFNLYGY